MVQKGKSGNFDFKVADICQYHIQNLNCCAKRVWNVTKTMAEIKSCHDFFFSFMWHHILAKKECCQFNFTTDIVECCEVAWSVWKWNQYTFVIELFSILLNSHTSHTSREQHKHLAHVFSVGGKVLKPLLLTLFVPFVKLQSSY